MREIKFRAWSKKEEKYYNEVGFHRSIIMWNDGYKKDAMGALTVAPVFENYIIEQYTGLKDKNGKEVYEGDIIKADIREYSIMTMGVIVYSNDLTSYCNLNDGGFTMLMRLRDIKIIGNIHENPELITGG